MTEWVALTIWTTAWPATGEVIYISSVHLFSELFIHYSYKTFILHRNNNTFLL